MLIQYQSKTLNDNVDFSPSPKMYDCIKTQRRFHRAFDLEYCTQSIIDEGLSETLMSFSILSHQVHFVLWGWLYETPSTQPGNKFPSTAKKSRSHSHTHTHTGYTIAMATLACGIKYVHTDWWLFNSRLWHHPPPTPTTHHHHFYYAPFSGWRALATCLQLRASTVWMPGILSVG